MGADSAFTVNVTDYDRIVNGHLQHVRRHKRRERRWFRKPKLNRGSQAF